MLTVVVVVDVVDVFSDVVAADVASVYCYCSGLSVCGLIIYPTLLPTTKAFVNLST